MSETNLVRPSRDGDQFHYAWAARRCLLLLSPQSNLKAVTIEGPSPSETTPPEAIKNGEELIDVAEYYGSENLVKATLVRYIQLKHSTLMVEKLWTPGELKKLLTGFAARYKELQRQLKVDDLNGKLEFWFVSNRPVNKGFLQVVDSAANGESTTNPRDISKLEKFTSLKGPELAAFCKLLRLQGSQENLWDQQNILVQDISCYLPDADVDAPAQLKELVTQKALSKNANNPVITKMDVLRALKTDERRLFPATCLIKQIDSFVPREQEAKLVETILKSAGVPVIIHAAGGVGKSFFAARIKLCLPTGSASILYDCFGDGQYRNASGYRHRHKDALVQIANELASSGLCHPLVPSSHSDPSAYVKAFLYRLKQSITSLRTKNPQALLCIIIDAADNAQMAAEEIGEARSFVRDLIRESLPEGGSVIFLCRTHRQELLAPPTHTIRLELLSFSRIETMTHLRQFFSDASEQDVDEFHRLSSRNPRVQALALSRGGPLNEILRALGPNPTTVEDTIGNLLNTAIEKLRDGAAGAVEKKQIDKICAGLAILRPLIPLSVLASMSGVDEAAIKSFALDLGRPLFVTGESIQFFDEPAETWFRERFKPSVSDLTSFIASLKPLAANSAYIASALPQLMLEAGLFAELVALALSAEALPVESPIEKRDIELQRLQFALKASLREKRYADAAKLALKAGGESAGNERQRKLLQTNTDLAAVFLASDRITEIVSRRTFGSGWVGSHHAYEASLLSGREELLGDARSRLRMACEWQQNWSNLTKEQREQEMLSDDDIVEMATAFLHIHGACRCAGYLRTWQPREVSFRVGRILASRLIDHERYQDLNDLAHAAGNDLWLVLAITLELRNVHKTPPKYVVQRSIRLVFSPHIKLNDSLNYQSEGGVLQSVTALVEAAYKLSIETRCNLAQLLTRYLPVSPQYGFASFYNQLRFPLLRAYALRSVLSGHSLNLIDLAHDDLRKKLETASTHAESQDTRDFKGIAGALLPWHLLWAQTVVGQTTNTDFARLIVETRAASEKAQRSLYREDSDLGDEIARLWFDTLLAAENTNDELVGLFNQWIANLTQPLLTKTLTHLARLAGRSGFTSHALDYANQAFQRTNDAREDAESTADGFVGLARALLKVSRSEASAYFNKAIEVASKIGDENLDRWSALLELANRAADQFHPNAEMAYKLSRCSELTYRYVTRDKHFDWKGTVEAITGLCGSSSLAILSRWRDRNFGWAERILPSAIAVLVDRGCLNPNLALALVAFRAHWDCPLVLRRALQNMSDRAKKQGATDFVYRYMMLSDQSVETWRELKNVLIEFQIVLPEIDERIVLGEREEAFNKSLSNSGYQNDRSAANRVGEQNWTTTFDGVDFCNPNGIAEAHRRFKGSEPPRYIKRFFEEVFQRVSVGKEADFVSALADVTEFDLYDLRNFFETIPASWKARHSVKPALAHVLKVFCRRFCMVITKGRHDYTFPFQTVCEISGSSELELIDEILVAVGKVSELVDAGRLFTLIGLLTSKLNTNEALEALSFGLELLDPILEDSDGDGPWSSQLKPPADIDHALAGYVWGALAAPKASLRWEAAHVVRALCVQEHQNTLGYLVELASGAQSSAFYDSHLQFYTLHARQWLLIALSRAAIDYPHSIAPHTDFLKNLVFTSEPHVLIREFAKRALLELPALPTDLRAQLLTVNISTFPIIESIPYNRSAIENVVTRENGDDESFEDRFSFGIDFGPYWLNPLGRCFGKPQIQIEREALGVIKTSWKNSFTSHWNDDERHRRRIYDEGETRHSHGSYPRSDELSFYLSYHAMMTVAGNLLMTTALRADSDLFQNEFQTWLSRHDLTRQCKNWVADRRDPKPLERQAWQDEKDTDEWRWSIKKSDFDQVFLSSTERMNLWGSWTRIAGQREESIHVGSALVSSTHSLALLRALQSVSNPHDYRIPDANDDLQIDSRGFQLKGWVVDESEEHGLDQYDPWAGSIRLSSPAPADWVTTLMLLNSDSEHRRWYVEGQPEKSVAWSQAWGCFREKDNDEMNLERGTRFQASQTFVMSLLQKLAMHLIVKVEITRHQRRASWEKYKYDEFEHLSPNARLFIVCPDGSIIS
jgi:hypothetical protein